MGVRVESGSARVPDHLRVSALVSFLWKTFYIQYVYHLYLYLIRIATLVVVLVTLVFSSVFDLGEGWSSLGRLRTGSTLDSSSALALTRGLE